MLKKLFFLVFLTLGLNSFALSQYFGGGGGSGSAAFADLTGSPGDNAALASALDLKAPLANASPTGTWTYADGTTIGTDGITIQSGSGTGDRITLGTATLATEIGFAGRVLFSLPSAGRFTIYENGQQIATLSADSMNWCAFAAGRDCTFQWGMGKGVSHYARGVGLGYSGETQGTNTTSGEDDVLTESIQGNALSATGDRAWVFMSGTVGTGGTKTVKGYLCGTNVITITTTEDSVPWEIECRMARDGTTSGKYRCKSFINTTVGTSSGAITHTWTNACIVKATGESGDSTTGDVLGEMIEVLHMKAGN